MGIFCTCCTARLPLPLECILSILGWDDGLHNMDRKYGYRSEVVNFSPVGLIAHIEHLTCSVKSNEELVAKRALASE